MPKTTARKKPKKSLDENQIYRAILDSNDVLSNALATTLLEELVASRSFQRTSDGESVTKEDVRQLIKVVNAHVERQGHSLVDRVTNILSDS